MGQEISRGVGKTAAGERQEGFSVKQQTRGNQGAPDEETVVDRENPLPALGKKQRAENFPVRNAGDPGRIGNHQEHGDVGHQTAGECRGGD